MGLCHQLCSALRENPSLWRQPGQQVIWDPKGVFMKRGTVCYLPPPPLCHPTAHPQRLHGAGPRGLEGSPGPAADAAVSHRANTAGQRGPEETVSEHQARGGHTPSEGDLTQRWGLPRAAHSLLCCWLILSPPADPGRQPLLGNMEITPWGVPGSAASLQRDELGSGDTWGSTHSVATMASTREVASKPLVRASPTCPASGHNPLSSSSLCSLNFPAYPKLERNHCKVWQSKLKIALLERNAQSLTCL